MTNIEFSQDGSEITHSVYTEFYFNESLSIGSDDIHVTVPNVPLFGLIKLMSKDYSISMHYFTCCIFDLRLFLK